MSLNTAYNSQFILALRSKIFPLVLTFSLLLGLTLTINKTDHSLIVNAAGPTGVEILGYNNSNPTYSLCLYGFAQTPSQATLVSTGFSTINAVLPSAPLPSGSTYNLFVQNATNSCTAGTQTSGNVSFVVYPNHLTTVPVSFVGSVLSANGNYTIQNNSPVLTSPSGTNIINICQGNTSPVNITFTDFDNDNLQIAGTPILPSGITQLTFYSVGNLTYTLYPSSASVASTGMINFSLTAQESPNSYQPEAGTIVSQIISFNIINCNTSSSSSSSSVSNQQNCASAITTTVTDIYNCQLKPVNNFVQDISCSNSNPLFGDKINCSINLAPNQKYFLNDSTGQFFSDYSQYNIGLYKFIESTGTNRFGQTEVRFTPIMAYYANDKCVFTNDTKIDCSNIPTDLMSGTGSCVNTFDICKYGDFEFGIRSSNIYSGEYKNPLNTIVTISPASNQNSSSSSSSSYSQSLTTLSSVAGNGIPLTVEQAAPNNGDANNDGILDSTQSNTASLPNPVTNQYISVEAQPDNLTNSCKILKNVTVNQESQNTLQDASFNYPAGLVNFGSSCSGSVNIKTYWYGLNPNQSYSLRKYNSISNIYAPVPTTQVNQIINGLSVVTFSYTVTDNGALDQDPTVGNIIDPVGPVLTNQVTTAGIGGGVISIANNQNTISTSSQSSSSLSSLSNGKAISSIIKNLNTNEAIATPNLSENLSMGKGINTVRTGGLY